MGHSLTTKFFSNVQKTSSCWEWLGARTNLGYGQFYVKTVNGQRIRRYAHRFSYELTKGKIPNGLVIDHLCRNTGCVNPAHLEIVTTKENALRGIGPSAVNARKTQCKNGHVFSAENTRLKGGKERVCRICANAALREYRRTGRWPVN